MSAGGTVVDYHGCDFFPERWFDLVVVLQTDNTLLWERLEKRCGLGDAVPRSVGGLAAGMTPVAPPQLLTPAALSLPRSRVRSYAEAKIQENVECEIMHVIVEEARESYRPEIVQVLPSNSVAEMDSNASRIAAWAAAWQAGNRQQ